MLSACVIVRFLIGLTPILLQNQGTEEAAIRAVFDDYLNARNERDAATIGSFFAEDYDQSNLSTGSFQIRSGKERADAYTRSFSEGTVRNTMTSDIVSLRLLTDDAAILDTDLTFVDEDGNTAFRNFASFIFVKRDGAWLIGAVRLSPYTRDAASQ